MKITIYSDGGARGNPGLAAVGCVIRQLDKETKRQKDFEISKYIGTATNNQAEYQAVIESLKWLKENYSSSECSESRSPDDNSSRQARTITDKSDLVIEFLLDSELVVEQLNGRYKVKNEGLKPLFGQIRDLVVDLGGKVTFRHIPREQNKKADKLVNQALDNHKE